MKKVIIIAEAGVNHNGDINTAKKLIDVAAEAGVDYVKFQSFKADKLVSPDAKKADYQIKNTEEEDDSQYQMLKQLELSVDDHIELIKYCSLKKINFFSTAFDLDGISYLSSLNLGVFKIPSGELTNFPYLRVTPALLQSLYTSRLDELTGSAPAIDFASPTNAPVNLPCR